MNPLVLISINDETYKIENSPIVKYIARSFEFEFFVSLFILNYLQLTEIVHSFNLKVSMKFLCGRQRSFQYDSQMMSYILKNTE